MNLYQLPPDKAQHVFYGNVASIVSTVAALGLSIHGFPELMPYVQYAGVTASTLVGAVKEGMDYFLKSGTPDFFDFLATALAGVPASLPLMMVNHL